MLKVVPKNLFFILISNFTIWDILEKNTDLEKACQTCFLGGHQPLYVTFSVCPSVRPLRAVSQEPYVWS